MTDKPSRAGPRGAGKVATAHYAKRHQERRAKEEHLLALSEEAARSRRPGQTMEDRLHELRGEER